MKLMEAEYLTLRQPHEEAGDGKQKQVGRAKIDDQGCDGCDWSPSWCREKQNFLSSYPGRPKRIKPWAYNLPVLYRIPLRVDCTIYALVVVSCMCCASRNGMHCISLNNCEYSLSDVISGDTKKEARPYAWLPLSMVGSSMRTKYTNEAISETLSQPFSTTGVLWVVHGCATRIWKKVIYK